MKSWNNEAGISLIGFLLVLVIIGLLSWYYLGNGSSTKTSRTEPETAIEQGQTAQSQQDRSTLRRAIDRYRAETGKNPPDLRTLVDEGYVSGGAIRDPEGNRYEYNPQTGSLGE